MAFNILNKWYLNAIVNIVLVEKLYNNVNFSHYSIIAKFFSSFDNFCVKIGNILRKIFVKNILLIFLLLGNLFICISKVQTGKSIWAKMLSDLINLSLINSLHIKRLNNKSKLCPALTLFKCFLNQSWVLGVDRCPFAFKILLEATHCWIDKGSHLLQRLQVVTIRVFPWLSIFF